VGFPLLRAHQKGLAPSVGPVDTKQVLTRKLEGLGAKIAARLGKEVTHVVFQRQRNADQQEQQAEDSELRTLFDKTAKVGLELLGIASMIMPSEGQQWCADMELRQACDEGVCRGKR